MQEHLTDLQGAANRRYRVDLADLRLRQRVALQAADDAEILGAIRERGILDAAHICARLGTDIGGPPKAAVARRLRELVAEGVLHKEGLLRARYRLTASHAS